MKPEVDHLLPDVAPSRGNALEFCLAPSRQQIHFFVKHYRKQLRFRVPRIGCKQSI